MSYQIIITEEGSANITIDNNTTNVSVTTTEYPITIEYNAVVEQAGGNAYGNANVAAYLASSSLTGNIITSANISGAYILGNGSQLTGLPATYGNANVAANLAAFGSNPISTSGNITAGNFIGNGSQLTGMYSNANVQAYLPTYSGNIGALTVTGNLTVTGTTTTVNTEIVNVNESVVGNVDAGNLRTTGQVTATGNITGGNISTSGNILAPNVAIIAGTIQGQVLTSNVAANNLGLNVISGNAYVAGRIVTDSYVSATGNIVSSGNISTSGNVIGAYLWGDGGNITGVVAGAHTVQFEVKNTSAATITKGTPVYATGTVGATTVVEVSASRADTASTMPALGILEQDLAVNAFGLAISVGTLNNVNTSLLTLGQELYVAAAGGFTNARPSDSYVVQKIGTVGRVSATTGTILVNIWNTEDLPNLGTGNIWIGNAGNTATQTVLATYTGNIGAGNLAVSGIASVTGNIQGGNLRTVGQVSATGNITGSQFVGNGAPLTNITGANVTGTVANAAYAVSAGSAISATTANTVTDAAQANITSVGTLTSLSVTGNVTGGNLLTPGQMSATGNVSGGNLILPNAGKIRGDFSSSPAGGRTVVQTTGTGTTAQTTFTAIPGPNHVATAGTFGAATGLFSSNDFANTSIFGMYSYPNEAQIRSTNLGTGTVNDITFKFGSGLALGATLSSTGNFSAVGNVTGANVITPGSVLATSNVSANLLFASTYVSTPALYTSELTPPSGGPLQTTTSLSTITGNLSVTGNITGGNVNTAGTVSATANTANVLLSNIRITSQATNSGQQYTAVNARDLSQSIDTGRMLFGNGFQGNVSTGVDFVSRQAKSRFGFWDTAQVPANYAAGAINMTSTGQFQLTGNTNAAARLLSTVNFNMIASEGTANTFTSTGTVPAAAAGFNCIVNAGNWTNNTTGGMANVGNVIINTAAGGVFGTVTNGGSTIGNSFGVVATNQSTALPGQTATNNNQIYFSPWDSIAAAGTVTTPGNVFAYYNPGTTNSYGVTHASQMRASANYYFLRNDDDVAQAKLGSLRTYHEFQYSTATSGTVNIDKNNAQVQFINPTANITIGSYLNFVTTANDGTNNDNQTDTVTLIIQQGSTPYTVTMPTGNASIKYLGGTTTVGSTANAVSVVTIKAIRSAANATLYLTEISSEYV